MTKSKIYSFSKEELQEIADSSNGYSDMLRKIGMCPCGSNPKTLKRIISEYEIDISKMVENRSALFAKWASETHNKTRTCTEDILSGKARCHSSKLLKKLVNDGYKELRCESCGLTEWQGKPIVMHLHHIDGNRNNNSLDNLQVLCPNCHSQTETYAGKNNKHNGV